MADSDIFVSNDIELDVDFGEIYVIDQGVVTKVVASKYDPTKTYVVGDYVIHADKLFKCITAIEEPEEFNSEKWTNVLLANEVQALNVVVPTKADKFDTYTKQEVNTALADKADKADTYTKQEVDTAVGAKADKSDTYTKQDVNDALALKADKADTYTKNDVNGYLDLKADKSDTYTKQEVDTAVDVKANSADVYGKSETYSKTEVDNIISNLPAPMIFKGTLGTGGTITTLPTASSDNEGYTYKVITDGTYAGQAAKAGDMFTSNGSEWIYIPSGDETFTDTWRGIKVNGTEKLTSAISSGEVDFINGTNTTVSFNSTGNKIKVDVDGYTQAQVDTKLSVKANSADVYTKSATDDKLALKANNADVYNKTTTDNKLTLKADKSTTYTKTEVDNLVNLISTVGPADICTFETTLNEPLPSVKTALAPSLTGYTAVNLTANGDTTTIALGDTYYGGTLDVTTGVLTVTHGLYVLDNTATAGQFDINTYTERNRISYVPYQTDGKLNGTFVSDVLTTAPNAPGGIGTDDWQIFGSTTAPRMWITVPTTIATVADFLTYISSNPIKVCYELATPVTVQLSPTAVRAIVGVNNVFAGCGQTTVEFVNSNAEDTMDIAKSVIEQTNLSDLADIPNPPTTDGNYRLKVTILSGKATYSWEEIT